MEKITELYESYLSKDKEERRINERIIDYEMKISRLEKKKSKIGGWHDTLVIPLAKTLTPLLDCEKFEILGPFGLRGETSIWFKKKDSTAKYCDYHLTVTVHNEFEHDTSYKGHYCSSSTKHIELRYDTGVRDNSYERGSIGELNGFNKIESPLPESIEDIVNLIKEKSTKE